MRRLLEIIAADQETILQKDKSILALQNTIKEKDAFIKAESEGISKQEMEKMFEQSILEKNKEISELKMQLDLSVEEEATKILKLNNEVERQMDLVGEKVCEIEDLKRKMEGQNQLFSTHEALKTKCEELMKIIMKQNSEMEKIKNDVAIQDAIVNRNETLQKEVLILKIGIQKKEIDLKNLNELLAAKDETIYQIKTIKEVSSKEEAEYKERVSTVIEEYEEEMKNLMHKVIKEQEINEQSENEIIQLRIELDYLRKEAEYKYSEMTNDETVELLNMKDEEIEELKSEITREQQVVAHVQMVQEKEIIEKEKAIEILTHQLNLKQKESECLRKLKSKVLSFFAHLCRPVIRIVTKVQLFSAFWFTYLLMT